MLTVEKLQAGYGTAQVLFDVTFSVGAGEVVTLLGRNGMGKTTTVGAIMGLVPPRGHAVVPNVTPTDISVVGPMARHAEDLDLALRVMAGPDTLQQTMWRLDLPAPRGRSRRSWRWAAVR